MTQEKMLLRIPLGEIGYLLLRELDDDAWRLTDSRGGEHELKHGQGRTQAVEALAQSLQELAQEHLAQLQGYHVELLASPGDRPGFRPGRQQRALTRVVNARRDFINRIISCAAQTGLALQEHGWPVPHDRQLDDQNLLVFYKGGLCAAQAAQ